MLFEKKKKGSRDESKEEMGKSDELEPLQRAQPEKTQEPMKFSGRLTTFWKDMKR
jgi:hypothetical protein